VRDEQAQSQRQSRRLEAGWRRVVDALRKLSMRLTQQEVASSCVPPITLLQAFQTLLA